MEGQRFVQEERYYLCRCAHFDVGRDLIQRNRIEGIRYIRWWTSHELRSQGVQVGPRRLPALLKQLRGSHLPPPEGDLGW